MQKTSENTLENDRSLRHDKDTVIRINREFKNMMRVPDSVNFTDDHLDHAADCIDLPVEKVLTCIDDMNNEITALAFFASETWRLLVDAGERPANGEFAIRTAPLLRRITSLSERVGSILAGLDIDAELNTFNQARSRQSR